MTLSPISADLHVVLGTGPVGSAITHFLVERGAAVRVVSRSGKADGLPEGIDIRAADLSQSNQAADAVAGASVVYHCAAPAYHNWVREFPVLQDNIVEAVAKTPARLVVLDNLYAYGTNGVLSEDLPLEATGPKGRLRGELATKLLADHNAGKISATIARSSDFIGPGVRISSLGERFWPQLLQGKTVQWFGNPDAPHSFTYVPDLARAMIRLGAEEAALGRAWHVPSLPAMSVRQVADQVARLTGQPAPKITVTPKMMMRLVGLFVPAAGELIEIAYQFNDRFEISSTDYDAAFGGKTTDLDAALSATINWWRNDLNLADALPTAA